jgi:hypothetical protein
MIQLPILRWGQPYHSVDSVVVPHFRTREPFVAMSQANVGLIRVTCWRRPRHGRGSLQFRSRRWSRQRTALLKHSCTIRCRWDEAGGNPRHRRTTSNR